MVPNTRISLDALVAAFKRGKTPEVSHDSYESVSPADVYAIFTYYLRHRSEVEAYLAQQEREGAEIQARIEAEHPLSDGLRAKLLAPSTSRSAETSPAPARLVGAGLAGRMRYHQVSRKSVRDRLSDAEIHA